MELVRNGLASAVLTLCVLILGALLWAVVSPRWPVFVLGWVFGMVTIWGAGKVKEWWLRDD